MVNNKLQFWITQYLILILKYYIRIQSYAEEQHEVCHCKTLEKREIQRSFDVRYPKTRIK
jgi:hypothetical protein